MTQNENPFKKIDHKTTQISLGKKGQREIKNERLWSEKTDLDKHQKF